MLSQLSVCHCNKCFPLYHGTCSHLHCYFSYEFLLVFVCVPFFLLLSFQSSIIRQHCSHRVQTGCHERFNGVQWARSTDVHMCIQNDNWRQLSANFCSLDLKHCCVSLLYLTALCWLQGIALPFLFASRIVFFPVCARKNNSDQKWVSSR